MLVWEPGVYLTDKGKKWDGEEGFMVFKDIMWARGRNIFLKIKIFLGMRFIMETSEEYIGIRDFNCYRT